MILVLLISVCFGGIISGCSLEYAIDGLSSPPYAELNIASPVPQSYINSTDMLALAVSGSCQEDGVTITLSGAANGTTVCNNGTWNATLDFTGAPEGPLTLNAEYVDSEGVTARASTTYKKDTVAPLVTLTSHTGGQLLSGLSLQNITWTASDNLALATTPIRLEYSVDNGATWLNVVAATSNALTYAWMAPLIDSPDCLIRITARDAAGNTTTDASAAVFEMDSSPPVLTLESLDGGEYIMGGSTTTEVIWTVSDANLVATPMTIEYSKDNGVNWLPMAANLNATPSAYTWPLVPSDDLATYKVRITAVDSLGHTSQVESSAPFTVDSTNPSISALVLNGGSPTAGGNVLAYSMTSADNFNVIGAWRLSATNDFSSAEWHETMPTTYTFPYSIGVTTATLYAQIRDAAGNISPTFNSNMVTVTMGLPPTLIITYPTESYLFNTPAQNVHISWKTALNSGNALNPNGLTISYSLDNGISVLPWPGGTGVGLSPGQNGGCTLDGDATGCVDLPLPASLVNEKFSIIVNVTDAATNSASAISTPQNRIGLKLIAGKNSSVLGQTGLAFSLDYRGGLARDPLNGDILMVQACQIVVLKAATGVMEKWAGNAAECSNAGDGLALSNMRFEASARWAGGGGGAQIVFDSQRNVYWASKSGIWKYTQATGIASLYVGAITMPYSNNSGTHRRSFSCDSISGTDSCAQATFLEVGVDDNLYFAVDTQADPFSRKLYKVNADNTVTLIAGLKAALLPVPVAGNQATTVGFRSFSIFPDKTAHVDRVIGLGWGGAGCTVNAGCATNGLWEVAADGTVSQLSATVNPADSTNLTRYIPSRNAIAYMEDTPSCQVSFINPADPAEVIPPMTYPTADCDIADVADGSEKAFYYTNTGYLNLYFTTANNTPVIYSGNSTMAGDGGLAVNAQIRSPRQVTMDNSGTYYFVDVGNSRIRKVTPAGNLETFPITTNAPYSLSLSSGLASTVYASDSETNQNFDASAGDKPIVDLNDIAAGSQFFAAPYNTMPQAITQDTAANAKTGLSAVVASGHGHSSVFTAIDGADTYIYMIDTRPGDWHQKSTIKKITGTAMTTVAGDSTAPYSASLTKVEGTPVLTSSAGETSCTGCGDLSRTGIKVAGGVIFKPETDGRLFAVDASVGTNTWTLIATGLDSTFALDPVSKDVYYFNGRVLWRKPWGLPPVSIVDFTGALKYPIIQNFDYSKPNTVILVDGDSIYTYTDAVGIP